MSDPNHNLSRFPPSPPSALLCLFNWPPPSPPKASFDGRGRSRSQRSVGRCTYVGMAAGGGGSTYRSRFGDTTRTKVFVGGLAWQTPNQELWRYYEQFGEILEAVVITDRATGRSKGYGFVTFRDAESARRACVEPNPVIDGRRANCNIASQGLSGASSRGRPHVAPHHPARPPSGPPPPPAPPYLPPYGYVTYAADYGYPQPAMYSPQAAAAPQFYGPSSSSSSSSSPSSSRAGVPYAYAPPVGYSMQTSPNFGLFPFVHHRMQGPPPPLPYAQYAAVGQASFSASPPTGFRAQAPPTRPAGHDTPAASESEASLQQQPSSTGAQHES